MAGIKALARTHPAAIQAGAKLSKEAEEKAQGRAPHPARVAVRQRPGLYPVEGRAVQAYQDQAAAAPDKEHRGAMAPAPATALGFQALGQAQEQAPGPVKERARAMVPEPVPPMWRALLDRKTVIFRL